MNKPFYKRIWFWALIILVIICLGSCGDDSSTKSSTQNDIIEQKENIEYKIINIETLFDDLEANAAKAKNLYHNTYVEISGYINVIDSDGDYISIESNKDKYWLQDVTCYIKNEEQLQLIFNKNIGDQITIQGKITSVGEIMGYSLNIDNIK